jgi:pimeloyl-ACP methyl ester carboxylesterase
VTGRTKGNWLRRARLALVGALAFGTLVANSMPARAGVVQAPNSAPAGDLAGLVDVGGGRHLYLECRGSGSPTVILVAGYRASSRYWTDDLLHPDAPRLMVLPGVSRFTRVCAYDRPGTYAELGDDDLIGLSDPAPQPRTAPEVVDELHVLLQAAGIPGPYVLAGHSLGGLFVRLYASTYPDEVAGLVLVDPYSEFIEQQLTPEQWADLEHLNASGNTVLPIPGYGDVETIPFGANDAMRKAAATSPLRAMPLGVLAKSQPFDLTEDALGFSPVTLEAALLAAEEQLAALVPSGRFYVASSSGHDIHQDQPALVTEAIREVVEGVRSPDTWYDLSSCCNK